MSKLRSVLVPAALCLVLLAPAAANAARKAAPAALAQIDTDKDGTVSADEIKTAMDARFDALDTDHDGKLEDKEMKSYQGKALAKLLGL